MNIGETMAMSKQGLITTLAASVGNHITYAIWEGRVFVGDVSIVIQWLRDELKLLQNSAPIRGNGRPKFLITVVFMWFTGIYWNGCPILGYVCQGKYFWFDKGSPIETI